MSLSRSPSTAINRAARHERLWMALCWLPYALLTWKFRFVCDDAFISFRYARNWVHGHGLRYNIGEQIPVEGYSNFLWVCLSAVVEWMSADPRVWMPVVSFGCGSALLMWLFRTLRGALSMPLWTVVPAVLFLGCSPPMAVWSTGGLETAAFALLLFAAVERVILRPAGPAGWTGGLTAVGLALIRAEGIFWALLIGLLGMAGAWMRSRRSVRPFFAYFGLLFVLYGTYFVVRYSYYGLALPHTAYVKVGTSGAELTRGWHYVVVFYLTFLSPLIAVLGLVPALGRENRPWALPTAVLSLAVPVYAIVTGGDFMTMGRLMVPALAMHAILFTLLLKVCGGRGVRRQGAALVAAAVVVAVGILPAWDVHVAPESVRARFHFRLNTDEFRSELGQWAYMKKNTANWTAMGQILKRVAAPEDSIVLDVIGAIGYYSDLFVYDRYGLVTREVTESKRLPERLGSPGHDLLVPPAFFVEHRPTFLYMTLIPPGSGVGSAIRGWVEQARREIDPNLYAPQIVNIGELTGTQGAPLLILIRRPPEGTSAAGLWNAYQAELRLWSV